MTPGKWRRSSRSQGGGNCVETRKNGALFQVRDSKLGEGSPTLDVSGSEFVALLGSVK